MSNLPTSTVVDNLRAIAEVACLYPYRSVLAIADALGIEAATLASDLLDLAGSEACEVIEAEIVVLSSGWARARAA